MKVDKITVCGGGNGAQTLVPGWARIIWDAMQVRLASHKHMGWTAWTNCFLLQLKPTAGCALRERME